MAPPRFGFVPPPRRWEQGRTTRPEGCLPGWSPADLATAVSAGGACLLCRLPTLPLALPFAPIPPTPFPGGEGGDQGYFMQGAPPLASPRLSRRRHGLHLRCRCPLGCLPSLSPADLAAAVSAGGLPSLSLANPAFSLAFCPHPPNPPSPEGKGVTKVISCKGLRPLHPRG